MKIVVKSYICDTIHNNTKASNDTGRHHQRSKIDRRKNVYLKPRWKMWKHKRKKI